MNYRVWKRLAVVGALIVALCTVAKTQSPKAPRATPAGLLERAIKGQAKIIDLTQHLDANAPTYGGERDSLRYEKLAGFDGNGYAAGAFRVPEHFGTHVDSPGHFIAGGATVVNASMLAA